MLENVRQLILQQGFCVLATSANNQPHTSPMAYVASPDAMRLYMISSRSSKKYSNLLRNPQVSACIVEGSVTEQSETTAVCLTGICTPMAEGAERDAARERLLKAHASLGRLAAHPDADILQMELYSVLLLRGAVDAYFESLV